jgi:hypothetical protein
VADDDKDKPPPLRVVSENPNAHEERQIARAKDEAQRTLSVFAATLLRTMAGSQSEAVYLLRSLADFIDAQNELRALSGHLLTPGEQREALRLSKASWDSSVSERRWLREHGLELIVQGALRLAAHQILGEQPHFGGKYSEQLIDEGIALIEQMRKTPPPARPQPKQNKKLQGWDDIDRSSPEPKPPGRRKPWSSRNSRSYRDLKPEKE